MNVAFVIVCQSDDSLSRSVANHLVKCNIPVMNVTPGEVGDLNVDLEHSGFWINEQPVNGILFRVSPNATFSEGFRQEDRSYCDAEMRAVWLAALHSSSILAINQYDATAWFEGIEWFQWRRRLMQNSIPVSDFKFGGLTNGDSESYNWYSYTNGDTRHAPGITTQRILGTALTKSKPRQKSYLVDGKVVGGNAGARLNVVAKALARWGIYISEIVTDIQDRVLSINTQPSFESNEKVLELLSQHIMDMYHVHLHNR